MKLSFWILLVISTPNIYLAQCENNLIKNGSFELDTIGEGIVGINWIATNGSPDLDNDSDNFPPVSRNGVEWTCGNIMESSDGGNWQNIAIRRSLNGSINGESFGQEVQLEKSIPHVLEFEFTAQKFSTINFGEGFASVQVFLNNQLEFTSDIDSTLFTWEKIQFMFTPNSKDLFIEFKINPINLNLGNIQYIAIDGVCLRPVEMNMFCEP